MSARCFADTNLIVYSRDASEQIKQPAAMTWLAHLWQTRTGRISTQVLSEYFVTVTRKLQPGLQPDVAWSDVESLLSWKPVPVDVKVLWKTRTVQDTFGFSWWDSLVVAAAYVSGCNYLLTENLQDGQDLGGLIVMNAFAHGPGEM